MSMSLHISHHGRTTPNPRHPEDQPRLMNLPDHVRRLPPSDDGPCETGNRRLLSEARPHSHGLSNVSKKFAQERSGERADDDRTPDHRLVSLLNSNLLATGK